MAKQKAKYSARQITLWVFTGAVLVLFSIELAVIVISL